MSPASPLFLFRIFFPHTQTHYIIGNTYCAMYNNDVYPSDLKNGKMVPKSTYHWLFIFPFYFFLPPLVACIIWQLFRHDAWNRSLDQMRCCALPSLPMNYRSQGNGRRCWNLDSLMSACVFPWQRRLFPPRPRTLCSSETTTHAYMGSYRTPPCVSTMPRTHRTEKPI